MQKFLSKILLISFLLINFSSFSFAEETFPATDSPSVILIDAKNGQVLYEKNSHTHLYPASITKVMTALLVLENCKLDEKVTASKNAIMSVEPGSSSAGLVPGEILTVEQLLYALMLKSANESANILAEHVGGSIENFATLMNKRAKELGALDSHFVTPNGLHSVNHYSSAYDMALITRQAMTIPEFREIVSTVSYEIPPTNKNSKANPFSNGNKLIRKKNNYYYQYATGIKTGYTTKAGHSLVAGASKNGMELIAVEINGRIFNGVMMTYQDSKKLFDYAFNNYNFIEKKAGTLAKQVKVADSKNQVLNIVSQKDIHFLAFKKLIQPYTTKVIINSVLKAPIAKGTVVGSIEYFSAGKSVGKTALVAQYDIQSSTAVRKNKIKSFFILVLIIIRNLFLGLICLIFLLFCWARISKQKIRRKRRRAKSKERMMKIDELLR